MEEMLSVLKDIRVLLQGIDEKLDYVRDDVNVMCEVLNDIHGDDVGVTLPDVYEKIENIAETLGNVCQGTTMEELGEKLSDVVDAIERQ